MRKLTALTIGVFLLMPCYTWAACTGLSLDASCTSAQVQAAIDAAVEGSTITIGAGEGTWTSTVTINKALTLRGSTSCTTSGDTGTAGYRVICDSGTVIASSSATYAIHIVPATPGDDPAIDVSGFVLTNSVGGAIRVENTSRTANILRKIRIHHNRFEDVTGFTFYIGRGTIYGLIDHNHFLRTKAYSFYLLASDEADWLLTPLPDYGSENFLFIEDNLFQDLYTGPMSDTGEGIKYVARYNTYYYTASMPSVIWNVHSPTQNAGAVASEQYENKGFYTSFRFSYNGAQSVIYNNTAESTMSGKVSLYDQNTDPEKRHLTNTYVWNNRKISTGTLLLVEVTSALDRLHEDEEYWDDYGTGDTNFTYDVATSRPGTCADDDCFWATDSKILYRCDGANNWTQVYAPYIYPHPLQGESTPVTSIPAGVHIGGGIEIK